jgi:hypothetical protein
MSSPRHLASLLFAWAVIPTVASCDLAPSTWPALWDDPDRMVAIGDLHGDLDKTREALRLAGAIDENDSWIGGELVVVQTGDICDRGPYDRAIFDLLERLAAEAHDVGGAVHRVLGNHELLNVVGNMDYVAPGGFWAFADMYDMFVDDPTLAGYPAFERPRRGAMRPAGPYALVFAEADVGLRIGRTVFVHGSLLPDHAEYGIERMSDETRAWLRGERPEPPAIITGVETPLTSRRFGYDPDEEDCDVAAEALDAAGAARMVIGHTIQYDGINSACDGLVWRIDTGMSSYYKDGPVEVLELTPEGARVLTADGVAKNMIM